MAYGAGVAGRRNDPAPPDPLEGLTADQLRELAARANETAEARAAEEAANADPAATPSEEEQAELERQRAEEELAATAQRIGLTPEQTEAMLDAFEERTARVTERVVREVLEEVTVVEEGDPPAGDPPAGDPPAGDPPAPPAPDAPPAASLEDLRADPDAPPPPAPPAPADATPESPPEKTHWFHRPLVKKENAE